MAERVEYQELPPRARAPITDHALVGDGRSAALVDSQGAIELWAPGRFDAPTVFLRLLDEKAGALETAPRLAHRVEAGYVPGTNVHRTRLITAKGRLVVTTFMPHAQAGHDEAAHRIIRILECEHGTVDVTVNFEPRFDCARQDAVVESMDDGVTARPAESDRDGLVQGIVLRSTLPLEVGDGASRGTFRLQEGERHALVLHAGDAPAERGGDILDDADAALEREQAFWREWLSACTYEGPYEDAVYRSLLALKLLQYVPEGSFVASPSFGLPECPRGPQNWDYRYTWLRDSAFIVMAFESMGYKKEALAFRQWLARVVKRDAPDDIRPLYKVDGSPVDEEVVLDHLSGYHGSKPVRVGNKATAQKQLDAYGDVMICFHRAPELWKEEGKDLWRALSGLADHALEHWEMDAAGIWEVEKPQAFTYSKGMVWLALDHALTIADKQGFDAPTARWRDGKRRIREWLDAHKDENGAFVQSPGHRVADGAALLFPLFGITKPDAPSVRATIERVERELVGHDLAYRHLLSMDVGTEGAFLAVNYWLAHDLAHLGDIAAARRYFDAVTDVASAVGLLPEEAEPVTGAGLGNHPLGLSHYSLVLAAYAIREAERERAREEAPATQR